LKLEPAKDSLALLFSQYTDILYTSTGEKYPYLVTGVLLNPNKVCAIMQKDINFESIELSDVENLTLESRYNLIGYNWKTYDFNNGIYTVNPNLIYLITDTDGYYYKLRFIGFYNDLGEKGFPKFEYQRL